MNPEQSTIQQSENDSLLNIKTQEQAAMHDFHPQPEEDNINQEEGNDLDQDSDDDGDIVARDLLNLDIVPGQI